MGKSKKEKQYEDALEQQKAQMAAYNAAAATAYQDSKKYTGDAGYQRALEMGQEGAQSSALSSIGASTTAARQAGMSKAQAAASGQASALDTYNSQLAAQQNAAYGSGGDAINAANTYTGAVGNSVGMAGQITDTTRDQWNKDRDFTKDIVFGSIGAGADIAKTTASIAGSDEMLKVYQRTCTAMDKKKKGGE